VRRRNMREVRHCRHSDDSCAGGSLPICICILHFLHLHIAFALFAFAYLPGPVASAEALGYLELPRYPQLSPQLRPDWPL
jgi:hypothetical protein